MAAILTNGVLKHGAHLSAAVGAGALQGLWEHKGSRCTPAHAAHSPPRRSPAPARARHAGPDGQAHSQPTDQPPSPNARRCGIVAAIAAGLSGLTTKSPERLRRPAFRGRPSPPPHDLTPKPRATFPSFVTRYRA